MELISRLPAASTPHERCASTKGELAPTEMKLCDMSGANFERPAPAQQSTPLQSAKLRLNSLMQSAKLRIHRVRRAQLGGLLYAQAEDMAQGVPGASLAVRHTAFAWAISMLAASPGKPLSPYEQSATLHEMANEVFDARNNMQQFLEEQELWLAEDHIVFGTANRIQDNEDEARENKLLRVRAVHCLLAQERPRAQDKDNAQYLEQENDGLRIQAGTKPDYTVAERPGEFPELGQPTTVAVAAAEPETGVLYEREMDTTAAARRAIFTAARSRTTTSRSRPRPTRRRGSTLNDPESRAFTTGPRPHAFGTKNANLAVYAKVKVGPLARIRIDDEIYT